MYNYEVTVNNIKINLIFDYKHGKVKNLSWEVINDSDGDVEIDEEFLISLAENCVEGGYIECTEEWE